MWIISLQNFHIDAKTYIYSNIIKVFFPNVFLVHVWTNADGLLLLGLGGHRKCSFGWAIMACRSRGVDRPTDHGNTLSHKEIRCGQSKWSKTTLSSIQSGLPGVIYHRRQHDLSYRTQVSIRQQQTRSVFTLHAGNCFDETLFRQNNCPREGWFNTGNDVYAVYAMILQHWNTECAWKPSNESQIYNKFT